MSRSHRFVMLAAAFIAAVAPSRVHAQAPATAPVTAWQVPPTLKLDLKVEDGPGHTVPVQVTIADSAGTAHAMLINIGAAEAHPMAVEIAGLDLVLTAPTPHGPMTVRLHRAGSVVTGTWASQEGSGSVTGTVTE